MKNWCVWRRRWNSSWAGHAGCVWWHGLLCTRWGPISPRHPCQAPWVQVLLQGSQDASLWPCWPDLRGISCMEVLGWLIKINELKVVLVFISPLFTCAPGWEVGGEDLEYHPGSFLGSMWSTRASPANRGRWWGCVRKLLDHTAVEFLQTSACILPCL